MPPAEWNSGGSWGHMTPEMIADLQRLQSFVSDIPLAELDPSRLTITSSNPDVRGWGVTGMEGGLFWIQDFSLEGGQISEVRSRASTKAGVVVEITGLADGSYKILPFDTWQGGFLDGYSTECAADQPCLIPLHDFSSDMAFKIMRND
jgi:hypothetical protein